MEIDKQVMELIKKNTEKTRKIIETHQDKIKALAEAVLAKETLNHQ